MNYNEFDKKRLLKNIYFLAKREEIKIGDLEKEAGVSSGYLSRISKVDNNAIPSVDVIYNISMQLDVSVDVLLSATYSELSPNEAAIIEFIFRIIKKTKVNKLSWEQKKYTKGMISKAFPKVPDYTKKLEIIDTDSFFTEPYSIDTQWKNYEIHAGDWIEQSKFYNSGESSLCGNCYMGFWGVNNTVLFLKNITHKESTGVSHQAYELYIVGEDSVEPLCNSYLAHSDVAKVLTQLYTVLEEKYSHIILSEGAKKSIELFMSKEE